MDEFIGGVDESNVKYPSLTLIPSHQIFIRPSSTISKWERHHYGGVHTIITIVVLLETALLLFSTATEDDQIPLF